VYENPDEYYGGYGGYDGGYGGGSYGKGGSGAGSGFPMPPTAGAGGAAGE
jgi:hypothetical protein